MLGTQVILALFAVLTPFTLFAEAEAEEIKIITGGTCYNQIFKKVAEKYEQQTQTKIVLVGEINTNSTEKIFTTVANDNAEAGCTAGNWRDVPDVLKKSNLEIANLGTYWNQVIGFDRLQIYLHGTSTFLELSDTDLRAIFSGKVKNWKELGGRDEPIVVIYSPSQGALLHFFEQKILLGSKLATAGKAPENMGKIIPELAKTPGGIALTSYGFGDPSVKMVKHSEIGRPITLFAKKRPSEPLRKFLVWLNNEGKPLIYD